MKKKTIAESVLEQEARARSSKQSLLKNITRELATPEFKKEIEEIAKEDPAVFARGLRLGLYKQMSPKHSNEINQFITRRLKAESPIIAKTLINQKGINLKNQITGEDIEIMTADQLQLLKELGLDSVIDGSFMREPLDLRTRLTQIALIYGKDAADDFAQATISRLKVRAYTDAQIASAFKVSTEQVIEWFTAYTRKIKKNMMKQFTNPEEFVGDMGVFYTKLIDYMGSMLPAKPTDENFNARMGVMGYILEAQKDYLRLLSVCGVMGAVQFKPHQLESYAPTKQARNLIDAVYEVMDIKPDEDS